MAKDILSIPATSMASEATFSVGGRVLIQFRSSLNLQTVEALICTGDWVRSDYNLKTQQDAKVEELETMTVGYMDKSWISADRDSLDYEIGDEKFLIFLKKTGFSLGYVDWIWHGAKASCRSSTGSTMLPPCSENIEQNVEENFAASQVGDICEATYNNRGNLGDDCDKDSEEFKRFLADAEQPLFEGSDSSKLDSMLKLYN
ncbi:hypothetical protein AgCh_013001 [Apium graveolens]